jgi:2-dehydropantoate 2-reductase
LKICFVGAGALGSTIGGTLTKAGSEVWLVDQYRAHVDAINDHGLKMLEGGVETIARPVARISAEGIGPADLIVVLVKSYHTRQAIEAARPMLGRNTVVMSIQNGMGHEDILSEVVGHDRVLAGKTYVGGVILGPGHVRAGVVGKETVIGELDGRVTDRVENVAAEFNRAGLITQVSDNIAGTIWDKLFINVATGAVSGITRLPYGKLYSVPEVERTAVAAVQEAMDVAKSANVAVSFHDAHAAWMKAAEGLPVEFKTSMLQSLEAGSPTELDFINSAVVRWGEKVGVPTPVNRTLVAMVKGIERGLAKH